MRVGAPRTTCPIKLQAVVYSVIMCVCACVCVRVCVTSVYFEYVFVMSVCYKCMCVTSVYKCAL